MFDGKPALDPMGAPAPPPPPHDPSAPTPTPTSGDRRSIPGVGHDNGVEDTDRRARGQLPIIPFLAAAVAVLFVFGAVIGTVAAKSRGTDHKVRRFLNAQMVIIAWNDGALRVSEQETADENARLLAKQKADQDAAAAAAAAASASAAPSTSTSAAPAPTDSVAPSATVAPTPTSKPKPPVSTYKPTTTTTNKTKPATTSTTKKPTKTPASPLSDDGDAPKKKKQGKEWWEKKF
jgi:hypothetical protein